VGRVLGKEGRNTRIGIGSGIGRGVLMGGIFWCYSEFMVAKVGSVWRGRKALGDSESDGGRRGDV
jgi:hypothetical protein